MSGISHHTKDKGDTGVAHVIACLMEHGIRVAMPLSDHLPFDLIAISPDGDLSRVSVKYRTLKSGSIVVRLESCHTSTKGTRVVKMPKGSVDAHAVYNPETKRCYFVNDQDIEDSLILRVTPAKRKYPGIRPAEFYLDPSVIFRKI